VKSTQLEGTWQHVLSVLARAFGWGEVFVLIPLHIFWVVFKSTPFGAENRASLLVLLVPFGTIVFAGLAMQHGTWRKAIVRAEWLFHLTSAVILTGLVAWVALRDPFNPLLPYTWPLCICGWATLSGRWKRVLAFGVVVSLWLALFPLASTMAWAPYFWTMSIIFHSIMAPVSRRHSSDAQLTPPSGTAVTDTFEGLLAGMLMLAALLRLLFTCDMVGAAEMRYPLFMGVCSSPLFFAGVALAVLGRWSRLVFLGHALVVVTLFLTRDVAWTVPAFMGYGLAVLFLATLRRGTLLYAVLSLLAMLVWVLGLLGFMLAGVIVVFQVGTGLAENLLAKTRMAILLFFCLWLFFGLLGYWLSKRKTARPAPAHVSAYSGRYAWAYTGAWLIILLPLAVLVGRFMWPPVFFERPSRIAVGEISGICHAGYSKSAEEYAELNDLGARLTRIPIYWRQREPEPDKWDFTESDAFLDAADKYGVKVVAALGFDNNAVELSPIGKQRGAYLAPDDIPLFLEYVRRTVKRYKNRVYAWEIWNEPDLPHFWTGTMNEFCVLARETAETIREVHPEARIIGTAMSSLLGLYSSPGIEGLHGTGALARVDHPAMHTYVSDSRAFYHEFRRVQNAAKKHGHPGSIWITELGAPDGGVYPWSVATGLRAEYAMKAYAIATSMGVEKLFWHCYMDATTETKRREPLNSEHFFGLVKPEGEWKPAAYAYRLFAAHCNNSHLRMDLVEITGGLAARQLRAALYRREEGHSALVMWFEPGLRQHAEARVTIDLDLLGETPMIHDVASQYQKPLVDGIVDLSEKPVFITFTAPDSETPVHIDVDSSAVDAAWLLFLAGLPAVSIVAACLSRESHNDMLDSFS